MPFLVLFFVLLAINWLFSEVLVFLPLHMLNFLLLIFWWAGLGLLLLTFSWFFGE
jgi:hypothetical protein